MTDIMISAFEPFDGRAENESLVILRSIPNTLSGASIETVELPVSYEKAYPKLRSAIERGAPRIVLMSGLARQRDVLTIERIAVNLADASIPDNDGDLRTGVPIVRGAADGYFTNLPLREILAAAQEKNIPLHISECAGHYVCNHLFYRIMHDIHIHHKPYYAGFIHIPPFDASPSKDRVSTVIDVYDMIINTTLL